MFMIVMSTFSFCIPLVIFLLGVLYTHIPHQPSDGCCAEATTSVLHRDGHVQAQLKQS